MTSASLPQLLHKQLLQLDVEYGNARGFFSASKSDEDWQKNRKTVSTLETHIPGATISIIDSQIIKEKELFRSTKFKISSDSNLFDLVSRFVVLSDDRCARIAENNIPHTSRNIYHQYVTENAIVPIGSSGYLLFSNEHSVGHPLFDNVFYIRDETVEKNGLKRWIVHHRMIVKEQNTKLIVRSCHPRFEGPLPAQWMIPKLLKRKLFRIREKQIPNFPLMAVGETTIAKYHLFDVRTKIQLLNV